MLSEHMSANYLSAGFKGRDFHFAVIQTMQIWSNSSVPSDIFSILSSLYFAHMPATQMSQDDSFFLCKRATTITFLHLKTRHDQ